MMKPVWRLNTGNGVPSDADMDAPVWFNDGYIGQAGLESDDRWNLTPHLKLGIYAYKTTRTKKAKINKLICDGCDGLRCAADFNGGEVTIYEDEICPDCNGKGYTLGTVK